MRKDRAFEDRVLLVGVVIIACLIGVAVFAYLGAFSDSSKFSTMTSEVDPIA